VPQLSGDLLARALDAAQTLRDYGQAKAIAALARHLDGEAKAQALAHGLDAALASANARDRTEALEALAPQLSGDLLVRALDAVPALRHRQYRSRRWRHWLPT